MQIYDQTRFDQRSNATTGFGPIPGCVASLVRDDDFDSALRLHVAAKLLAFGGFGVIGGTGVMDALIARNLEAGALPENACDALLEDDQNDICHANCMQAVEDGEGEYRHMLGYALSADGLWHEHSWLVDSYGTIVETTGAERIAYIGEDVSLVDDGALELLNGEFLEREAAIDMEVSAYAIWRRIDVLPREEARRLIKVAGDARILPVTRAAA